MSNASSLQNSGAGDSAALDPHLILKRGGGGSGGSTAAATAAAAHLGTISRKTAAAAAAASSALGANYVRALSSDELLLLVGLAAWKHARYPLTLNFEHKGFKLRSAAFLDCVPQNVLKE